MRSPSPVRKLAAACAGAVLTVGCGRLGYDTLPVGIQQGEGGTVSTADGDNAQAAQASADPESACGASACQTQVPLQGSSAGAAGAEGNPRASLAGGGSNDGSSGTAGGHEATVAVHPGGGSAVAGGSQGTGAGTGTGGAVDSGGSAATAGASQVGGDSATGGSIATGGSSGSSGASASGGEDGTGGSTPVDYCREIPALGSAPVLDGTIDPGAQLVAVVPVGWRGSGSVPDGYALSYAAAWLPEGLYFFLRVEDPDRNPAEPADASWAGDGVELYVDADGAFPPAASWDDPGARQFSIAAPADDTTPSTRAESYVIGGLSDVWASTSFVCVPTAAGYDLEAFVQAADLGLPSWTLSANQQVGIDLAHNVSLPPGETGPFGNRDSQYFLHILDPPQHDGYDFPFMNENAFCTATLLEP